MYTGVYREQDVLIGLTGVCLKFVKESIASREGFEEHHRVRLTSREAVVRLLGL